MDQGGAVLRAAPRIQTSPFERVSAVHHVAPLGLTSLSYTPDGTPSIRYESSLLSRARYRSGDYWLINEFLLEHLKQLAVSGNPEPGSIDRWVSSVDVIMDIVWPQYRAKSASRVRRADPDAMLGCWMLPRAGDLELEPGTFWLDGAGPPLAAHYLAVDLANAYLDAVTIRTGSGRPPFSLVSDSGWCRGFSNFLGDVFSGAAADLLDRFTVTPASIGRCRGVKVHIVNRDPTYRTTETWAVPCTSLRYTPTDPYQSGDDGVGPSCSTPASFIYGRDDDGKRVDQLPWNEGALQLVDIGGYSWFIAVAPWRNFSWPYASDPAAPFTAIASSSYRSFALPPTALRLDGQVIDATMTLARLFVDQKRYLHEYGDIFLGVGVGASDSGTEGITFGRFALAVANNLARLYVHELGHVYLGGSPHCGFLTEDEVTDPVNPYGPFYNSSDLGTPRWAICWEIAARNMETTIMADNGLPQDSHLSYKMRDYLQGSGVTAPSLRPRVDDFFRASSGTLDGGTIYARTDLSNLCSTVEFGLQASEYDRGDYDATGLTICSGRFRRDLDASLTMNAGFTLTTTQGCSCSYQVASAPSDAPPPPTTTYCFNAGGFFDPPERERVVTST
jgi:hypothetical protein